MKSIAILGLIALSACAGTEAGFDVTADHLPPMTGPTSTFAGTVVDPGNGCLKLEEDDGALHWLIWPEGTRWEAPHMILPDGAHVTTGDRIDVTGQTLVRSELPDGDNPDGKWGSQSGFCLGPAVKADEILRAAGITVQ
ncbi:hypothetical protein G7085_11920 [Tessaracoccus sp. HDW20]|uniref:hypothetical protein n=1 Tax=Tessaracoccus coleopterorum TaxID=2714950 RepID=UPI0018D4BE07|nr:hypothetical protein [Tessaracoccus coleopterorum]NHB85081.1 hypothetical protein [Tessaracoccus coleopterorum]